MVRLPIRDFFFPPSEPLTDDFRLYGVLEDKDFEAIRYNAIIKENEMVWIMK